MNQAGHGGTGSHRSLNRLVAGIISFFMTIGALAGASSVKADSVWVQSYERSSQTQECVAQSWETPWQASWGSDSSWTPSWERWANNGNGGWTCTRSITWERSEAPQITYRLGDIGPGGGLIFLIANGLTYEMAPKTWSGLSDPLALSCDTNINIAGAKGIAIGTGQANTAATIAACTSGASNDAAAYRGGGFTDWFLPSKDELNSLYSYSIPFDLQASYAFVASSLSIYWSSSKEGTFGNAWRQNFSDGAQVSDTYNSSLYLRPIRAF